MMSERCNQSHVESHRLFELAHLPAIVDLHDWEHIKDCAECGITYVRLVAVAEGCFSRLTDPVTVDS
jgi:hypothetical protein